MNFAVVGQPKSIAICEQGFTSAQLLSGQSLGGSFSIISVLLEVTKLKCVKRASLCCICYIRGT
jgi:hypothetical protein